MYPDGLNQHVLPGFDGDNIRDPLGQHSDHVRISTGVGIASNMHIVAFASRLASIPSHHRVPFLAAKSRVTASSIPQANREFSEQRAAPP